MGTSPRNNWDDPPGDYHALSAPQQCSVFSLRHPLTPGGNTQKQRSSSDVPSRHLPSYLSLTSENRKRQDLPLLPYPKQYQTVLHSLFPYSTQTTSCFTKNITLSSLLQNHMKILQTHPSSPPTISKTPLSARKKHPPQPTSPTSLLTDGCQTHFPPHAEYPVVLVPS